MTARVVDGSRHQGKCDRCGISTRERNTICIDCRSGDLSYVKLVKMNEENRKRNV
jgi:hypothetical protein